MSYFMTSTITSSRPRWLNRGKIQPSGMTNHPKAPLNLSAMCREPGQCPVWGPWGCQGGHFVCKGPVVGWKQLETTNNWCSFFSRSQMLELFATAFLMSGQGKKLNNFLRSLFLHINFFKVSRLLPALDAWRREKPRNDACKLGWVVRLLIDRCENDKIGVIEDAD